MFELTKSLGDVEYTALAPTHERYNTNRKQRILLRNIAAQAKLDERALSLGAEARVLTIRSYHSHLPGARDLLVTCIGAPLYPSNLSPYPGTT